MLPPFANGMGRGAPVWGPFGNAAGLRDIPGSPADAQVWTCVPRSSGAQSGGSLVQTGLVLAASTHTQNMQWSPDGALLAVAGGQLMTQVFGLSQTLKDARFSIHLLHWRTGECLSSCAMSVGLAPLNKDLPLLMPDTFENYWGRPFETLTWAANGRAVQLSYHTYCTSDVSKGFSATLVVSLDRCS